MAKNWLKENNPRYKHGCTNTRLFHIWQHMKARCNCPTNKAYGDYGGRGITVCPEWNDFYVQSNNRRCNHLIAYKGKTKTLAQWAVIVNLPKTTLYNRIEVLGWSVERALTTPRRK